jgi:uncharacterized membrane protein HdeD (DUF308 family)
MPTLSLVIGVVLLAVGLGGFIGTGARAPTALIPAALGVLLIASGLVARNARARRHAMHAAVLVALVGALGCLPGVFRLPALLSGQPLARPAAVASQCITFVLCAAFVVSAVRSFIQARRSRAATP